MGAQKPNKVMGQGLAAGKQQGLPVDIQTMIAMTTDAYKKAKSDLAIAQMQNNTLSKIATDLDKQVTELKAKVENLEWELSEMEKGGAKRPDKKDKPKKDDKK